MTFTLEAFERLPDDAPVSRFSSRIIKGGALLEDSRRFLETWRPEESADENLARIRKTNALGKGSRSRAEDVLPILRQRLVDPGPEVTAAVHRLGGANYQAFREACSYEAARSDALLAAFAEGPLFEWWEAGRIEVTIHNVVKWLCQQTEATRWGEETRTRVAHGLLSALRDFGMLEGSVRKRFAPPRMSVPGFGYVALRERSRHASARGLYRSSAWRRYLLDEERTRYLFLEADRLKLLRFSEAGTALRIDWLIDRLEDLPVAAA